MNYLTNFVLLFLITVATILPLSYDEAFTFNNFIDRPFKYAIASYPAPNNHVFSSAILNLLWDLFFWTKSTLIIRILSIGASYYIMKELCKISNNLIISNCVIMALLLNSEFIDYSFQARGYAIQNLLAFVFVRYLLRRNCNIKLKIKLFYLISVIGLYTSPAFLYTLIPLSFILMITEITNAENKIDTFFIFIRVFFYISITLFLLYSPIIYRVGIDSLIGNKFVKSNENLNLVEISLHYANVLISHYKLSILIIGFCLIYAKVSLDIKDVLFFGSSVLIPLFISILLKQTPFDRVFLPLFVANIVYWLFIIKESQKFKFKFKFLNPIKISSLAIFSLIFFSWCNQKYHGDLDSSFLFNKHLENRSVELQNTPYNFYALNVHWYFAEVLQADCKLKGNSLKIVKKINGIDTNFNSRILIYSNSKWKESINTYGFQVNSVLPSLDDKVFCFIRK